jgi:cbb3-type cytochrome oxidase maturation protein
MDSLFLLIPLSIVVIGLVIALFLWAVRSGQFDDMEGPAHDILTEDEIDKGSADKAENPNEKPNEKQ